MNPVLVLLLLRAENPDHADRAWGRMADWEPAWVPSTLDDQVNEALRLTRTGADPVELCKYDEATLKRHAREQAENARLEESRRRFRR